MTDPHPSDAEPERSRDRGSDGNAQTQHERGRVTTADNTELHWIETTSDRARATVLLVHGLGEHSGRYHHVVSRLQRGGYRVVAFDLRGHGESTGQRVYVRSYDEFMDDIWTIYRNVVEPGLDGHPLALLGHSMGGNLAMGFTLRHQDVVDALALSGPLLVAGSDINPVTATLVGALGRFVPRLGVQTLDAASISSDADVVAAYRSDPLVYNGKVTAGLAAALLGEMRTFPQRYPELTIPVLTMHGTADLLTDPSGSQHLADGAVNTEVTVKLYDGLYHEIFNEPSQSAVLDDLIDWLDTSL